MHKNNFGFLRLIFAALVVLSHSPYLVDGNFSRDILKRIFGTMNFGDFAVDGFFLVSGYLVTSSLVQSRSNVEYLCKRILRIYPGYIVAYIFSLFVAGWLGGATIVDLKTHLNFGLIRHMLLLRDPELDTAFVGQHLPGFLNLSMWTLGHEFRCYCILMILGSLSMLRRRKVMLAITAGFMLALILRIDFPIPFRIAQLTGYPVDGIRFLTIFFCGSCFYLFSDKIAYTGRAAVACAAILSPLMFIQRLAEGAVAVFGAYILFWFAFQVKAEWLPQIGDRYDLSYGLYLYAWPIQKIVLWHFPHISPWVLCLVTLVLAGGFAFVSWITVERPSLRLKRRLFSWKPNQISTRDSAVLSH